MEKSSEAKPVDSEHCSGRTPKHTPVVLEEGLLLVRMLEPLAIRHGFHVALGGSVLHRGASLKDLDVIVYQHQYGSGNHSKTDFIAALRAAGAEEVFQTDREYLDKDVVLVTLGGKRIDLFFL